MVDKVPERKRSKAKPCYYCYDCLRKYGKKRAKQEDHECPICDGELRRCKNCRTRAQTVSRLAIRRGIKAPNRKSDYQLYLSSPLWRQIRGRILDRDNQTCQHCDGVATDVHHLSYAANVMAGEDDSQLVALCVRCHDRQHLNKPSMEKRRPIKT